MTKGPGKESGTRNRRQDQDLFFFPYFCKIFCRGRALRSLLAWKGGMALAILHHHGIEDRRQDSEYGLFAVL